MSTHCALFVLALSALTCALSQTIIKSLTPSSGSLAGGTRLSIYGSGFGDPYVDALAVFVGPYPCMHIGHYSSSEVLTCETSPGVPGTYPVYVSVGKAEPVTYYGFTYSDNWTPSLKVVAPRGGPPGTQVFLYGGASWRLQYDCTESAWGETNCLGNVIFGDYLCRMDPSVNDTGISFTNYYTTDATVRYGGGLYRIGCVLPVPNGKDDTQPALGTAKNSNATVHFEASFRGGVPRNLRYSYQYDADGKQYQFQLHAEVSGVTPASGSNAGGTLLKLAGKGFPDLDLGLGDNINISIVGVPCTIVNSTYDTIFCVTGPKPAVAPASATPIRGLYPGMRGVLHEFYNTSHTSYMYWSELWKLGTRILLSNTTGTGSYQNVLTSVWESQNWAVPYHCSRMRAFFKAPRSGNYSFYLQADDVGQLNGTWLQTDGTTVTQMLVNLTGYVPTDEWFYSPSQRSPQVLLEAGQTVLLESAHCNNPSIGHQQIGVRMPVEKPQANSMSEYQKVDVSSILTPRSVAIKLLWGAGGNTTAYTVTILTKNDTKFDDYSLGLELTLGSGADKRVVVLPVTASGASMSGIIAKAYGLNLTADPTALGVLKDRSDGMLTVQIGFEANLGEWLGFDVVLARMVVVPKTDTFTPSPCASTPLTSLPLTDAAPSYVATKGLVVVVSPARPEPAVDPTSSFFQLRVAGGLPIILPYSANGTLMISAIRNLTGHDTLVSVTEARREGTYFAHVWTVTFPQYKMNDLPDLIAESTGNMADGTLILAEVQLANPPVTGTFQLSFGTDCAAVEIDVTDSADVIRFKLSGLPLMIAPLSVEVSGGPAYGYAYLVTFDPIGNPGDQPELRIADVSGLGGISPVVRVTTIRNGSTDAFYAPVPAEFLEVPVAAPGTINVVVNGVPSSCAYPAVAGVCAFQYSDAATPLISSVSPQSLSFSGVSNQSLTITGSGFTADVDVRVGGAVCNVTLMTTTQIVCNVPDTAPAGIRLVTVNVQGLGFAGGAPNVTVETLYVTGSAPASPVLASSGWSILNFTGKGFDSVNCANNKLFIANTECGVLACGSSFLTILFASNLNANVPAAQVTAKVYEGSQLIDTDAPASPTVQISTSAPAINAISPANMPGAGGIVDVTLTGASPNAVASIFMVPEITSLTNFTLASSAYKGRIQCSSIDLSDGNVKCNSSSLPNGRYHVLVVLTSGLQLLSPDTILFDLVINGISPAVGSIGGGTTITITGAGFNPVLTDNAVFITVPVSSTFLNGIVECDVATVAPTHLTCVTRPHLAADADVDDPQAKKVMPRDTVAAPVSTVLCDPGYNTTLLRGYCWSLSETPRARCGGASSSDCSFGYDTAVTPIIESVFPSRGYYGDGSFAISVSGQTLQDISVVEFMQGGVLKGLGTGVSAGTSSVYCTIPDLPAGVYNLRLKKPNGEMSVDPYGSGTFTYYPTITAVANNGGSLAGGLPLSLAVGGAGLALGSDNITTNVVSIAGVPCPILAVTDRWHLTCRAPGINGYVLAEYWNLGVSSSSLPDLISFTDPVLRRLEKGLNLDWGSGSPLPGLIQTDFFAARFTFYYQMAQTENVSFYLSADDASLLYVDDVYLGKRDTVLSVVLEPGVHKIVVTYMEGAGLAAIKMQVTTTYPNGWAVVEWQKVTPVPPGEALPVELTVNGIDSDSLCPQTTVINQLPYQAQLAFEPPQLTLPYGACSYVYSMYRTPSLTLVKATGITAASGIVAPTFVKLPPLMSVYGTFPLDPQLSAASQLDVRIGSASCQITNVSPFLYVVTTTSYTVVNGTNTSVVSTTTTSLTRINCTAPPLPVGTWPVSIMVAGAGLTRPTASATTDLPVVTYGLQILNVSSPINTGSCMLSLFGGGTVTVNGYGFAKDVVDPVLGRNMTGEWYTCGTGTTQVLCQAATNTSRITIKPTAADGYTAAFRLSRYSVANPAPLAGNITATSLVRFRIRVNSNTTSTLSPSGTDLNFCGGRTPVISNVSPAFTTPSGAATLTLTWYLANVGSNLMTATAAGATSNATVELEVGPTVLSCSSVTVTASNITNTTYRETVACQLPAYVPAASYALWVCIQPFGCGLQPVYSVPLTVSGISATTGSSAGGIIVTVSGLGFDTNSSLVSARFEDSACKVTSSSATSLVCETGPLAAKPASAVTFALSVTPTVGASEVTFPASTFTFDPALEATVTSITPARGSTEGGTPVTVTGADFQTGVPTTVTIDGTTCTSVVVVNSSAITCTTGKPPGNVLRVPLPVKVMQQERGYARGNLSYQYIDLWSRNSTWSGGPVPGFEDSVVIPKGLTVLLDMSPPKLYFLVLEGNLIFDDTLPYINLQAHYILVKGGNFSIGTADTPFPGRANITMHGAPNSLDLPMYGAKALGVRTGVVTFNGLPKIPIYTKLNKTADVGATSIAVNGAINWVVGDRIIVASSSYMGNETEEATITALDGSSVPGCTVITLDSVLNFTHLGEIHSVQGVDKPLDMRAEVAVLTRNIVLQGDYTSAKNMYGVQVMVNTPSYLPKGLVRFDNVEITQSGQAFRLGRYSMHWHLMGDLAYQSWVRGCSIHHTYNRAITIHGTHRSVIQNTLAYNTMGHTFFMEDGIETMNLIEGNIGVYAKTSDALLNTDVTPGMFWITNPNNTVRNNVAVGSLGYGFWYRMLDHPEGPSYTTTVCPKFTPLLEFSNNTAHSNMFYGLRIHPEFYPRNVPCNGFKSWLPFEQEPAVFNGLVAYKNGVKGAVASQVGLVQFTNMVMGDNGGGPRQHIVSGKDHGGNAEISWVTDDRNRYNVDLTQMAGFQNMTIYARTSTGMRGTAGYWPSERRVTAIIAQSPVNGDPRHSALMSMVNMTMVDFSAQTGSQFSALEHCGKCKTYQGGATTFTAGLKFVNADGSKPVMSVWSWGHQGIFLDTDGSLINANTVPADLLPSSNAGWTVGPGTTWHSAVESELFDPAECVYVRDTLTSNNGAFCSPDLTFRRAMLNNHGPPSIQFKNLMVVSLATNRSSTVHFTHYNEEGYQFTTAVGRDYWLHWNLSFRFDPEYYHLHKMDLMNVSDFVYYTSKYIQPKDHFLVNGLGSNLTALPPANSTHGTFSYNKTFTTNTWWWSNRTFNDTKFTVIAAGIADYRLQMASYTCPDEGCTELPPTVVDLRDGILYWSDPATWNTSFTDFKKPALGDNVTIPFGWNLVIDESPPWLLRIVIQGNVSFDPTKDVNLTANYIIVMGQGALTAGNATVPHPTAVTIYLNGTRDTPDFGIDNSLNLGSKVLAAVKGGRIELYGRQVNKVWTRLTARTDIGASRINVSDTDHGWRVGDKIIITSTTFNVWQSEIRMIKAILNNGASLQLDSPLAHPHGATIKAYPGGPTVDMRAEVGLISSNILITALDGYNTHSYNGEMFGARVIVSGNSTGKLNGIAMHYCGQAGFVDRACVFYDRLESVRASDGGDAVSLPNPSFLNSSALIYGMSANVRVGGNVTVGDRVVVTNNVMFESWDNHGVEIYTSGNLIQGNLVLGTFKDMEAKSSFDIIMPSAFYLPNPNNFVSDNMAAGSERYGYTYKGVPCSDAFTTGYFRNNSAHSCLAGLWLTMSWDSEQVGCTLLQNFTTYMNWDFGIISTRGITTDVVLRDVNILDNKHAGLTLLRKGGLIEEANLWWYGGLLAGQSNADVCAACTTLSDPGCHKKLSIQSYNLAEPFTPAVGLTMAQFALAFYDGPEKKPWDKAKGYAIVHGKFNISGVTVADFMGSAGCNGPAAGTFALSNHHRAMETFWPHFFSRMNVINVNTAPQGMFHHTPPSTDWLGETACGDATYARADGSVIPLNCAGPAHVYWRDLDGTLTGTPGTISGIFPDGPRVFPMDQGTPVLPGPCTYSPEYDSYSCVQGSNNFLLDPRLKPYPVPTGGIYGDPQYFVLESRDKDSEDRNFGPVFFNVSGSIDLVTVQADHGCCFTYKCQKRLSTFATYIPTGQVTYINFTGTPSQVFRMWLPYADPDKEVVVVINYLYTINRRFVFLPKGQVEGKYGRLVPETKIPQIGDGTPHGAYYWDQFHTLMYVKLTGGKMLEVRTENAVYVTQSFALRVDEFYDIEPIFLENLAYAMSISKDRIYIAKVVAGSATVTSAIAPEATEIDELSLNEGSGEGEPRPSAPLPEPPIVLTDYDKQKLAEMGADAPSLESLTWMKLTLLRQLWALFDNYKISIKDAASKTGFQTLGEPTSKYPSLGDPEVPPTTPTTTENTGGTTGSGTASGGTTSTPTDTSGGSGGPTTPGGSGGTTTTPTNPGSITESGPATTTNNNGAAEQNNSDGKSGGLSGAALGAIIAAVVGGCVLAAVIAAAVLVVRRRHAKRTRPASPPSEVEPPEPASPTRISSGSPTGSVREAFVCTSPTGGTPVNASTITLGTQRRSFAADLEADPNTPLGSPRAGYLAAGRSSASQPEMIRPLASTAKMPHSSMPLVLPTSEETAAVVAGRHRLSEASNVGTKTPAALQRNDSLARNSAPQQEWDADAVITDPLAHRSCRVTQSVTEGGRRPGSGRPGPQVGIEVGSDSGAAASAGTEAQAALAPAGASGETMVAPLQRNLDTQESYRPRSRAARTPSRPASGEGEASEVRAATPPGLNGADPEDGKPERPTSPQQVSASGQAPRPMMMLPGGLMEYAATASLLRSEAAALMIAGGSSAEGFGGAAAAVMREEQEQRQGDSPTAPRSPAGLRSDSMRIRD